MNCVSTTTVDVRELPVNGHDHDRFLIGTDRRLCPGLYTRGSGEENTTKNKRKRPFYDEPGFEKRVEEMPAGKEKSHLEALLKRLKPKQVKTMQQQMKEYLAKKQMQCDPEQV